ncbi:MAG: V-type ATP synthase subunit I [Lachnospiraceae bacterium]
MAILQMQRLSVCAMKKDRKSILEQLQSWGVMEVNTSVTDDESLRKMDTIDARQIFEKNAVLADRALEVLQEYAPVKTSMLDSLKGKELLEKSIYEETLQKKDRILSTTNRLLALKKKIAEATAGIIKLETQMEALVPWLLLDIPMDYTGTKKTITLIGAINSVMTLSEIYEQIAERSPELDALDIQIISTDKDQTYIVASSLREDAAKLEESLRTFGFSKPSQLLRMTPLEQKKQLEESVLKLKEEIEQTEKEIKDYAGSREELKLISDYFRARSKKYEILGEVLQSKQTFIISGYIPTEKVTGVEQYLTDHYDLVVDIEDIKEGEETPILLKNGTFSSSVEGVIESYGLPIKSEIDPSKIVSFFYVFFFGLMLSDAAYGLIVFIACFIVLKKFPRMAEGMNKTLHMFMYCGISTLFWGILFGGFFGDAIQVVSRVFFGHEIIVPALWFIPLNDPMRLLLYSMLFGTIHLFVGLGIKGYMCIRDKKYLDFVCDVVLWYALLIGLILILIPSDIFSSIAGMKMVFPPFVTMLSKLLAIVGAVGIVLMSGRSSKNPGLRIALGAYDLYNITGWLSDVLSYSRLLALGLATGVIASVINQMGSMVGNSIFGIIVFIIVFVAGHLFNMAINLLGAYVHTNRLQFVEFFGKFYEGGGRAFHPFNSNTKYVDIKEETSL